MTAAMVVTLPSPILYLLNAGDALFIRNSRRKIEAWRRLFQSPSGRHVLLTSRGPSLSPTPLWYHDERERFPGSSIV
jgi:hypothetical protein